MGFLDWKLHLMYKNGEFSQSSITVKDLLHKEDNRVIYETDELLCVAHQDKIDVYFIKKGDE